MEPVLLCPTRVKQLTFALLLAVASPLCAQPDYRGEPRVFRHQIQLQGFHFDNFFQARGDRPEEDVNAAGFEYTAAYRFEENSPDVFGAIYVLNYAQEATDTSYGGRIGVAHYTSVHSIYAYVDRMENGWSFDTGETTANANITSLLASYSYRLTEDWQVGLDTYNEWQNFDVETGEEGPYNELEAEARYRGFGRIFEPRVGYGFADRDASDEEKSYGQRHWFVQLSSRLNPRLDLTLRYRARTRDYDIIDRNEDRNQTLLRAVFRMTDRLAWTAAITHEDVDSSVPNGDFDKSRIFAGITVDF